MGIIPSAESGLFLVSLVFWDPVCHVVLEISDISGTSIINQVVIMLIMSKRPDKDGSHKDSGSILRWKKSLA